MHINSYDVNAWFESTKLDLSPDPRRPATEGLNEELEEQVSSYILTRLGAQFPTYTTWVDRDTTPVIVRTLIAMWYAAAYYDLHYADDAENNAFADKLRQMVELQLSGILSGQIPIPELPDENQTTSGQPSFFPNDLSSSLEPTPDNPSDGGPYFMMGSVF